MVNDWSPAYVAASRDNKPGWYKIHNKHTNTAFTTSAETIIIGDSIALGLERYKNVWHKHFKNATNLGIAGDSTQHVLWRVRNTRFNRSIKYALIHCGTNNIDSHQPESIAEALINISEKIHLYNPDIEVILSEILPRDSNFIRANKITSTNVILKNRCLKSIKTHFLEHTDWTKSDGTIKTDLFFSDRLHLNERGNEKLSNEIITAILKIKNDNQNIKRRNDLGVVGNSHPGKYTCTFPNRKSSLPRISEQEKFEYICPCTPLLPPLPSSFSPQLRPKRSRPTRSASTLSSKSSKVDSDDDVHAGRSGSESRAGVCDDNDEEIDEQPLLSMASLSFLLLLFFSYIIYNPFTCIYHLTKDFLMFFVYKIFNLTYIIYNFFNTIYFLTLNCIIFCLYILFLLFYKFYTYSLILLIFINLSNTLYDSQSHNNCNVNIYNPFIVTNKTNDNFYVNRIVYNIFNICTGTGDWDHNFLFSENFYKDSLVLDVHVAPVSSSRTENWILVISLLSFLFKIINKKKHKHIFFNSFCLYVSIFLFPFTGHYSKHKKLLQNCTKTEFFTIETINESNYVGQLQLKTSFYLLTISKMKYGNHFHFFQLLLLLSGDIHPNPGPLDPQFVNTWAPFNKSGLHFIHININSLLPKIDEIRSMALNTNAALIGITESKLDESIPNSEININNYILIRNDRNRNGGGVACYIREDINFTQKNIFKDDIECIFVDILLPKTKTFTVGIFYRPPNKTKFIENINEDFHKLHSENNDVFILGDMNINLFQNEKYIGEDNKDSTSTACPLLNKYKEFISTFGLKQLIRSPTRVTCGTASLIDHVLTNTEEKISQSGVLEIGISDHQLIFCTRKLNRIKSGTTKYINFRSMKKYTKAIFLEKLRTVNFPDYEDFPDANSAYSDFLSKLTDVINQVAPLKQSKVKNRSQEWFDGEVAEKISERDKLFKKFKKSRLHVDEICFKEARNVAENLIKKKKKECFENKINDNIKKPKRVMESPK